MVNYFDITQKKLLILRRWRYFDLVVLLAMFVLIGGILYARNLTGNLSDDDEGTFLYQVWQMNLGQVPVN